MIAESGFFKIRAAKRAKEITIATSQSRDKSQIKVPRNCVLAMIKIAALRGKKIKKCGNEKST